MKRYNQLTFLYLLGKARLTHKYLRTCKSYLKEKDYWGEHPDHLLDELYWWEITLNRAPTNAW